MGIFFAYSLKSAICLALFYLFYKALLSRETFHRFNRITLLCIIGLAISIPFLATFLLSPSLPVNLLYTAIVPEEIEIALVDGTDNESASQNNWLIITLLIYVAGICLCILRNTVGIIRMLQIIRKGKRVTYANHIHVVVHDDNRIAPFSWMKYIIISRADLDETGDTILIHEKAHICHRHTIDLCLAELCILFQWYNPAAWLLHRELQAIHEYQADETVINQGIEAKQYQLLLIKKAVGSRLYSMANSFNHSNLKKRITMMLQKKSNAWARLKYVYILPLTAIAIAAFARPEISQSFEEISSVKVSDFIATIDPAKAENVQNEMISLNVDDVPVIEQPTIVESLQNESVQPVETNPEESPKAANLVNTRSTEIRPAETINGITQTATPDTTVYTLADNMPEFPGGADALMKFISDNIVYPKIMSDEGIQGRIIASFVVTREGSIRDIKLLSSLHPEADAEAVRVLGIMPKWTPGKLKGKAVNVKYTVPVNFRFFPSK